MAGPLPSTKVAKSSTRTNVQILPQTKQCPLCDHKFTRVAHLTRHLRAHTNDREYQCTKPGCNSHFTRSDLLRRHLKTCGQQLTKRSKRLSCEACAKSKVRCDLQQPCAGCSHSNKDCIYVNDPKISRQKLRLKEDVHKTPETEGTRSESDVDGESESARTSLEPGESSLSAYSDSSASVYSPSFSTTSVSTSPSIMPQDLDQLFPPLEAPEGVPMCFDSTDVDYSSVLDALMLGRSSSEVLQAEPPASAGSQSAANSFPFASSSLDNVASPSPSILSGKEQQYMMSFFNTYLPAMISPVLHSPSWTPYGKPWILLRAMQACGALTSSDNLEAQAFVSNTFMSLHEAVAWEFTRSTDVIEQDDLILAITLLLTIPCYHNVYQEHLSTYHRVLCDMILKSNLIKRVEDWRSLELESRGAHSEATLDLAWRHWSHYETTKRMFLFAYSIECDDAPRRATLPSFNPNDMNINLVCDQSLFDAPTAAEWLQRLVSGTSTKAWGYSLRSALIAARSHYNFQTVTADMDHCSRNLVIQSLQVLWYITRMENRAQAAFPSTNGISTTTSAESGSKQAENNVPSGGAFSEPPRHVNEALEAFLSR